MTTEQIIKDYKMYYCTGRMCPQNGCKQCPIHEFYTGLKKYLKKLKDVELQ